MLVVLVTPVPVDLGTYGDMAVGVIGQMFLGCWSNGNVIYRSWCQANLLSIGWCVVTYHVFVGRA